MLSVLLRDSAQPRRAQLHRPWTAPRLTGRYDPPSRFQDQELIARLSFNGFLAPSQLLGLIDTELATRAVEIARFRYRDRRLPGERPEGYSTELADLVGDWSHEYGADAMDAHIEKLAKLRRQILDTPLDEAPVHVVPASARAPGGLAVRDVGVKAFASGTKTAKMYA